MNQPHYEIGEEATKVIRESGDKRVTKWIRQKSVGTNQVLEILPYVLFIECFQHFFRICIHHFSNYLKQCENFINCWFLPFDKTFIPFIKSAVTASSKNLNYTIKNY